MDVKNFMLVNETALDILNDLKSKKIISSEIDVNLTKGTTDDFAYIVSANGESKYVLKKLNPDLVETIEDFFVQYQSVHLLPELIYSDRHKGYILYHYLRGTTHLNRGLKKAWMKDLTTELFNQYRKVESSHEWGRVGIPRRSWKEFNQISVELAYNNIGDLLPDEDYYLVLLLVNKVKDSDDLYSKYLLHGDTGVHNFVFHHSSLAGVIDPSPIIGPIIYDFTYAFCSSPDDLSLDTLLTSYSYLEDHSFSRERLLEEVVIQLYTRIGVCNRVHPQDLKGYLEAWDYWKNQV